MEHAKSPGRRPEMTAAAALNSLNWTIVDVLTLSHNQTMERFAVLRQALAEKVKPLPDAQDELGGHSGDEQECDALTKSKLGGVLVLLIPVAGLAWVGIGWVLYRFIA
jgi:hypothetical protein